MDLITSPTIVALNTQSGAPRLAQAAAQLIDALVLQVIDASTVRLQVAGNVVDVKTEVPLDPGTQVRLAVRGYGEDSRWVIVGTNTASGRADAGRAGVSPVPLDDAAPTQIRIGAGAPRGENDSVAPQNIDTLLTAARAGSNSRTQPAPASEVNAAIEFVNATSAAAARQTGLAPVFAELGALLGSPEVPPPVRAVAAQLLQTPAKLDVASATTVRQAVRNSGLFFEARLAGDAQTASAAQTSFTIAPGDLKAALFTLRQALQGWMDALAAPSSEGSKSGTTPSDKAESNRDAVNPPLRSQPNVKVPAPPYRGAPTSGQQPISAAALGLTGGPDIARSLFEHVDGALARQVLMQVASLPDSGNVAVPHLDGSQAHWNLEIPFMTSQGVAIAQMEIERDGHRGGTRDAPSAPWRANFSLDLEPMGPIHAQIALTGKRAAVRIWAERKNTAAVLRSSLPDLAGALRGAALETDDIIVRDGAPPRPFAPKPGRFLDRAS